MGWWEKMVKVLSPVRRVLLAVAARVKASTSSRKTGTQTGIWLHLPRPFVFLLRLVRNDKKKKEKQIKGSKHARASTNRGSGILKLRDDVRTCGYQDVQVMWEMLLRSEMEEELSARTAKRRRPFWEGIKLRKCHRGAAPPSPSLIKRGQGRGFSQL